MANGEMMLYKGLKDATWRLVERQSAPFGRSSGQVVTWGEPYWEFEARYENLSDVNFRALRAWITRRMGSRYTFLAYDPSRPKLALSSTGSNTGITLNAVDTGAGTITLGGLGSQVISPGDMLRYYTAAGGNWVGESLATATPTAGVATVQVHPAPFPPHAASYPRIYQALGEFRMIGPANISAPHDMRRSVSFSARQVIRG